MNNNWGRKTRLFVLAVVLLSAVSLAIYLHRQESNSVQQDESAAEMMPEIPLDPTPSSPRPTSDLPAFEGGPEDSVEAEPPAYDESVPAARASTATQTQPTTAPAVPTEAPEQTQPPSEPEAGENEGEPDIIP